MKQFLIFTTLTLNSFFCGFTIHAYATHQGIIACSTSTKDVPLAVQNASQAIHTVLGNLVSSTKSDNLKKVLSGEQAVSCESITEHSVCLDKAISHAEAKAGEGDILAQYRLGERYSRKYGILDEAYEKAKFWFTKSAEQGSAIAQYYVGGRHIFTLEGLEWMTKSAQQGYAPAQYFLGHIYYEESSGVEPDPKQAKFWMDKAVQQGYFSFLH